MINDPSAFLKQDAPELPRDRILKKISEDESLPTLGVAVSKVVEITSSGEDSVAKLAHFVLSDVGLTQKILRLSNTIQYRNTSGVPVTTISRAIFLLGFNTVKTSALAMLLVDCFHDKRHAQSVRKELIHALCASIVGREMSQRSVYHDSEEAAVAALFKNVGRVLVASFDHQLHGRIQAMIDTGKATASEASDLLLGCPYERFGELALQDWKIPDTIVQSLGRLPGGTLRRANNRNDWLKQVASFSDEVADKILTPTSEPLFDRCKSILLKFGTVLDLDKARMEALLTRVELETRELAKSMDIAMPPVGAGADGDQSNSTGVPSEFLLKAFDSEQMQEKSERYASGKPVNARDLLLAGVQDVTQMLASEQCKLNDLVLLVLETLYSSMGFRFATACLRDVQSSRFVARIAVGENYAERQKAFVFPTKAENDIFNLAMVNNADLMISDAMTPKIQSMLPAWHKTLLPDARSFIVLPLVIQKKPLGLFYADRAVIAEEGVPPDETALIKTLKSQLLAAMMRG
ncbi:HDOD domain-containing protein [Undibacterium terreum]|uniref:HDOD domain-containing protein n=1 Tax=Undibacterium terreum TaxID=1224302 RepID=A0A916V0A8_9BURK|nr:HDOD domain-containing protein [Undibacterium terreum]GGC98337.1 HDOD domain-containing protein [Undibacterium terreum]